MPEFDTLKEGLMSFPLAFFVCLHVRNIGIFNQQQLLLEVCRRNTTIVLTIPFFFFKSTVIFVPLYAKKPTSSPCFNQLIQLLILIQNLNHSACLLSNHRVIDLQKVCFITTWFKHIFAFVFCPLRSWKMFTTVCYRSIEMYQ